MTKRMKPWVKAQVELNALARGFVVVVDRPILREIMLISGGEQLSNGRRKMITKKYLGASVYRLKLEED